ncbi:transmembrane permease, partial [gut metagenome]
GVAVSLFGIIFLIVNSVSGGRGAAENSFYGIFMMFLNGLSFALYLGIFKPIISRYRVVTFMKWIFLFSTLFSLPMSAGELSRIQWGGIPKDYYLELGFLILFATFVSYFLIPFGQKLLRPTLVSMYSYVQPVIAIIISIILGMDVLTWQKILATVLVFAGVAIVSRSPKRA